MMTITVAALWNRLSSAFTGMHKTLPLSPFDRAALDFYVGEQDQNYRLENRVPETAEVRRGIGLTPHERLKPDLLLYNARERMQAYGWANGGMALRQPSPEKIMKAAGLQ